MSSARPRPGRRPRPRRTPTRTPTLTPTLNPTLPLPYPYPYPYPYPLPATRYPLPPTPHPESFPPAGCLVTFDDVSDRDAYLVDPEHVAFTGPAGA